MCTHSWASVREAAFADESQVPPVSLSNGSVPHYYGKGKLTLHSQLWLNSFHSTQTHSIEAYDRGSSVHDVACLEWDGGVACMHGSVCAVNTTL